MIAGQEQRRLAGPVGLKSAPAPSTRAASRSLRAGLDLGARVPDQPFRYRGVSRPNSTQVPDDVFDVLLPELTESELKVLHSLIRRTLPASSAIRRR
jgi:hypothetical protein